MTKVKIKQFKNKKKEPVAGLTPEHAIYDKNGVRLDAKLGNVNLSEFRKAQDDGIKALKNQEKESLEILREYDHETIINNGTINNAADEEDITVRDNVLSFKDRTYTEGINEMGYIILRKNKSFAEQVTKENTIYEIRYNFIIENNITIPTNCVLKFNGGSLSNGNVLFNNTLLEGIPKFNNCMCDGSIKNSFIHTEWFGAVGDGETDNRNAFLSISRVANATKSLEILFENDKIYLSSVERFLLRGGLFERESNSILYFKETDNITIDLNQSTIKMIVNVNNAYNIICALGCKDVTIKNGKLVGDGHEKSYIPYIPDNWDKEMTTYEFCFGINANGSHLRADNLEISYCCGDGIYVGSYREWLSSGPLGYNKEGSSIITNCKIHNCGRQGISYHSSKGYTAENIEIYNIGTYDTNPGFSPMSGMDFEFEDGLQHLGKVNISNCYIHDTTKHNIIAGLAQGEKSKVLDFVISDSIFKNGMGIGLFNIATVEGNGTKIINSYISGNYVSCDHFIGCDIDATGYSLIFYNGILDNCYIHRDIENEVNTTALQLSNTKAIFRNCIIEGFRSDNFVRSSSIGDYSSPINAKFINCLINHTFINIQGERKNVLLEGCDLYDCLLYNTSSTGDVKIRNCNLDECSGYIAVKTIFEYCNIYNENTDLSKSYSNNAATIGFGRNADYNNCIITAKQQVSASSFDAEGTYTNCIIKYDYSDPFKSSIVSRNYVECVVSGIPLPTRLTNKGTTAQRPSLTENDLGFVYFDMDLASNIVYSKKKGEGTAFLCIANRTDYVQNTLTQGMQYELNDYNDLLQLWFSKGNTDDAEKIRITKNFTGVDTTEYPYIMLKNTTAGGRITFVYPIYTDWLDAESNIAGVKKSGTFAEKPDGWKVNIGFRYFCTNKQTSEGATDGIVIYYKGNNVWIDALGRVVS